MSYLIMRAADRQWAGSTTTPGLPETVLVGGADGASHLEIRLCELRAGAGDLAWLSVDGTHGFVNERDEPARWLEVQSPVPPDSDAFFFPADWRALPH